MSNQEALSLTVSWSGQVFHVTLDSTDTVATLKRHLQFETMVAPERQKLMLKDKAGKPPTDATPLGDLKLPAAGQKIMMLGSREEDIQKAEAMASQAPEVADDFEMDEAGTSVSDPAKDPFVLEKLERRIKMVDVKVLNPPRPGKSLVVLDIDYTIFDLGGTAERPEELARPYLHEFLRKVYQHYDIIIWSATSMKWVEVKMRELGVLGAEDWKIVCLLDHQAMLTVTADPWGTFDCKPMQFIWSKFPEYNSTNSILFDDLGRNFVMAPKNGHKIKPYRKYTINKDTDKELKFLGLYLVALAELKIDISTLKHKHYMRFLLENGLVKKRPRPDGDEDYEAQ